MTKCPKCGTDGLQALTGSRRVLLIKCWTCGWHVDIGLPIGIPDLEAAIERIVREAVEPTP